MNNVKYSQWALKVFQIRVTEACQYKPALCHSRWGSEERVVPVHHSAGIFVVAYEILLPLKCRIFRWPSCIVLVVSICRIHLFT